MRCFLIIKKNYQYYYEEKCDMSHKIPIETSARHVHLSKSDFETLYGAGAELTFEKPLSQPGQFLAKERITVKGPGGSFENMAVLGPFRKESQV